MNEEWIEIIVQSVIAILGILGASAPILRMNWKWRLVWRFVSYGVERVAKDFVEPVKETNEAITGSHKLSDEQINMAQEMAVERIREAAADYNAKKPAIAPTVNLDDDIGALLEKIEVEVKKRQRTARKGGKGAGA